MEAISNIIRNILGSIYQITGAALLTSVLFSIFLLYAEEIGIKQVARKFFDKLKSDRSFRWKTATSFYVAMILYRTVLCRPPYYYPLADVFGGWSIVNEDGSLYTDGIENLIHFIPYSFMVALLRQQKSTGKLKTLPLLRFVTCCSFASSLLIEFIQLMLRAGTFQLADLFYNTLGGVIGCLVYIIYRAIKSNNDAKEK